MKTAASIILAFVTAGLFATPGSASSSEAKTHSVSYADLDLSQGKGVRTLKKRVDNAIIAVCGAKLAGDAVRAKVVSVCRKETRATMAPRIAQAIAARAPRQAALQLEVAKR